MSVRTQLPPLSERPSGIYNEDHTALHSYYQRHIDILREEALGTEKTLVVWAHDGGLHKMSDYDDPLCGAVIGTLQDTGHLELDTVIATGPNASEDIKFNKGHMAAYGASNTLVYPGRDEYWPEDPDTERHATAKQKYEVMTDTRHETEWRRKHDVDTSALETLAPPSREKGSYIDGLSDLYDKAIAEDRLVSLVVTTGLQSLNEAFNHPRLADKMRKYTGELLMQGNVTFKDDEVLPDETSRNMRYDLESARQLLGTLKQSRIPGKFFSKECAFATSLPPSFFSERVKTNHPAAIADEALRQSVDDHLFHQSLNPDTLFSNFTPEMYCSRKTTLPKTEWEPLLEEYKTDYGTADGTEEEQKQRYRGFQARKHKDFGGRESGVLYDIFPGEFTLNDKTLERLEITTPYVSNSNSKDEELFKVYGQTANTLNFNPERARDLHVALTSHAALIRPSESGSGLDSTRRSA